MLESNVVFFASVRRNDGKKDKERLKNPQKWDKKHGLRCNV